MRIARILLAVLLPLSAVACLTAFAHARGFMLGVGPAGGCTGACLTITCPATGLVSVPSSNFTITYPSGTFNGTTNTISFSGAPPGGTFTPAGPVTPTNVSTSTTFTYTPPATPGVYTITVSNNIVVPESGSPCNYNATSAVTQNPLPLLLP